MPTAIQAQERVELWLRERQVAGGGEVLIITGRGRGSPGGIAVVRPAVHRRLARLRRQGVVADVREHTPGSFVVVLAPLRAMLTASRRKKDPPHPSARDPVALAALHPATRAVLRELATRSLDLLGAPRTEALVADEMSHQFARLAGSLGRGPDRESRLRAAASAALDEIADGPD
jgi:hypothetical protein